MTEYVLLAAMEFSRVLLRSEPIIDTRLCTRTDVGLRARAEPRGNHRLPYDRRKLHPRIQGRVRILEHDVHEPAYRAEFGRRPAKERKPGGDGVDALRCPRGSGLLVLGELRVRDVEEDLPVRRVQQPDEAAPDRALAGSALSNEADDLFVLDLETDIVHGLQRGRGSKRSPDGEELAESVRRDHHAT